MNVSRLRAALGPGCAGLLCVFMLAALLGQTAGAEETSEQLGRLFFTPERRQNLDRLRQLNIQEQQEIPEDTALTINGVVTRSSGKRTVWINGVTQNENDMAGSVSVTPNRRDPARVTVHVSDTPVAKAKVGETVNRDTGEATDLLSGGRIGTKSTAAK